MHVFCPQCGAPVGQSRSGLSEHQCRFDRLVEFQTRCAQFELEHGLEDQVAAWEREPRLAKRLAFARYVRERALRAGPGRSRPVPHRG
jgi:hypothetical protein